MKHFTVLVIAALIAVGPSAVAVPVSANHTGFVPVEALRQGRYVILFRHTTVLPVTQVTQDSSPLDLKNCGAQIPLSDVGREDARRIGRAFRFLAIPVGGVLSSPFCRTMETGLLAFGRAEPWEALLHPAYVPIAGAPVPAPPEKRVEAIVQMFRTAPRGGNTVLITHGEVIRAAAGFAMMQGEAAIYRTDGRGGHLLIARVMPMAWGEAAGEPTP